MASLIGNFCLSVPVCSIVQAEPSLSYTCMLLGCSATKKQSELFILAKCRCKSQLKEPFLKDHTHIHTHAQIHTHTHTHAHTQRHVRTHRHVHTHTHKHTHTHTHRGMCVHTHIHTHTHTHTTHTQSAAATTSKKVSI